MHGRGLFWAYTLNVHQHQIHSTSQNTTGTFFLRSFGVSSCCHCLWLCAYNRSSVFCVFNLLKCHLHFISLYLNDYSFRHNIFLNLVVNLHLWHYGTEAAGQCTHSHTCKCIHKKSSSNSTAIWGNLENAGYLSNIQIYPTSLKSINHESSGRWSWSSLFNRK